MEKIISKNKKAYYDYEILEKLEAGLILTGFEAKSVRNGNISLKGSFVNFRGPKLGLTNMHIGRYKPAGPQPEYEPERWRELLLHKKQIAYLRAKSSEKGLTIIPLKVYTSGRLIKVEIGVGKGKKNYNKKEIIKKRDLDREIKRTLKNIS